MSSGSSTSPDPLARAHCLDCGYPLRGLSHPRCPECGAEFDPADSVTFTKSSRIPRSGWPLLILAAVGLALVVAAVVRALLDPISMHGLRPSARMFINRTFWPGLLLQIAVVFVFLRTYLQRKWRYDFLGLLGFEIAALTLMIWLAQHDWLNRGLSGFLSDVIRQLGG